MLLMLLLYEAKRRIKTHQGESDLKNRCQVVCLRRNAKGEITSFEGGVLRKGYFGKSICEEDIAGEFPGFRGLAVAFADSDDFGVLF